MSRKETISTFDSGIVKQAITQSLLKLSPRYMVKNPVMFMVEVGSALTTVLCVRDAFATTKLAPMWFSICVTLWLWFTVIFANFAEALAEGRGRAQADSLRRMRRDLMARRLLGAKEELVAASQLLKGQLVIVEVGGVIPADGEIIEGIASVDESAVTGESAPVIREAGGDRSAVTGGTKVLSDRIIVRVSQNPGESFLASLVWSKAHADRKRRTRSRCTSCSWGFLLSSCSRV